MKKAKSKSPVRRRPASGEMRAEYEFSGGVRGKYAAQYAEGTNVVVLAPDVAARFPTADAVNRALRAVAQTADVATPAPKSRRRSA